MFIIALSLAVVFPLLKYHIQILASTAEVVSVLKTSSQQSERICTVKQLAQSTWRPLSSWGLLELEHRFSLSFTHKRSPVGAI